MQKIKKNIIIWILIIAWIFVWYSPTNAADHYPLKFTDQNFVNCLSDPNKVEDVNSNGISLSFHNNWDWT